MANRVKWPGGWADLSTDLTHGRRMRIVRVLPKTQSEDPASVLEFSAELAAAHITAWSLGEVEGNGPDTSEMDGLPASAVDALTTEAVKLWTTRADPNATTPASADGPSESA